MKRVRWLLIAVVLAAIAGGVIVWKSRDRSATDRPTIPLEGTDPEIAKVIRQEEELVRREPASAKAWGRYGMTLLANKFADEAVWPLQRAEQLEPANPRWPYLCGIAWLGQNPDEAIACFRRAEQLSSDVEQRATIRLRLAETLLMNGQHDEAATFYEQIPSGPLSPCVAYGRGVLAVGGGQLTEAKTLFAESQRSPFTKSKATRQALAVAQRLGDKTSPTIGNIPDDIPWPDPILETCMALVVGRDHRLQRANLLEQQGKPTLAIDELRGIVRDYPDATSHLALGIALGRQGNAAESEQQLRECLKREPQLVRAQYYLSLALFAQGELAKQRGQESKRYFAEAAQWAKRATELTPHHGDAHFQLGLCYWCLEEHEQAIAAFRQTIATRPELVDGHYWLAKALAAAGQTQEAITHAERARLLAPNDARINELLGGLPTPKNP